MSEKLNLPEESRDENEVKKSATPQPIDLTPVITYIDEETGEVYYGGTDSPEAEARRAQYEAAQREYMIQKYGFAPEPNRYTKADIPPNAIERHAEESDDSLD